MDSTNQCSMLPSVTNNKNLKITKNQLMKKFCNIEVLYFSDYKAIIFFFFFLVAVKLDSFPMQSAVPYLWQKIGVHAFLKTDIMNMSLSETQRAHFGKELIDHAITESRFQTITSHTTSVLRLQCLLWRERLQSKKRKSTWNDTAFEHVSKLMMALISLWPAFSLA